MSSSCCVVCVLMGYPIITQGVPAAVLCVVWLLGAWPRAPFCLRLLASRAESSAFHSAERYKRADATGTDAQTSWTDEQPPTLSREQVSALCLLLLHVFSLESQSWITPDIWRVVKVEQTGLQMISYLYRDRTALTRRYTLLIKPGDEFSYIHASLMSWMYLL